MEIIKMMLMSSTIVYKKKIIIILFQTVHLGYVNESCWVLSTLQLGFLHQCGEHKYCINCAFSSPESKLFRSKQTVGLCSIRHVITHSYCDQPQQVGGDGNWPVLAGIKWVPTLNKRNFKWISCVADLTLWINMHFPRFKFWGTTPSSMILFRKTMRYCLKTQVEFLRSSFGIRS